MVLAKTFQNTGHAHKNQGSAFKHIAFFVEKTSKKPCFFWTSILEAFWKVLGGFREVENLDFRSFFVFFRCGFRSACRKAGMFEDCPWAQKLSEKELFRSMLAPGTICWLAAGLWSFQVESRRLQNRCPGPPKSRPEPSKAPFFGTLQGRNEKPKEMPKRGHCIFKSIM